MNNYKNVPTKITPFVKKTKRYRELVVRLFKWHSVYYQQFLFLPQVFHRALSFVNIDHLDTNRQAIGLPVLTIVVDLAQAD